MVDAMLEQRQDIRTSLAPPPDSTAKPRIPAEPESVPDAGGTSPAAYPHQEAGDARRILLWLCNIISMAQLPETWRTVDPLKKDRARSAMEATCWSTANDLHFSPPPVSPKPSRL